jgi:DNA-directed RNA polymerase specialized sigma24 family protein
MGFMRDREELSQEVLCRMLEGKNRSSTIDQIVIDALRERTGRKGQPSYDGRKNLYYSNSIGPEELQLPSRDHNGVTLDDRLDIQRGIDTFRGEERAFLVLRYVWGMNEVEIGNIFGVSESRISQRLTRIQERLSARIKKEAGRERKRTGPVDQVGKGEGESLPRRKNQSMEDEKSRPMETAHGSSYYAGLT